MLENLLLVATCTGVQRGPLLVLQIRLGKVFVGSTSLQVASVLEKIRQFFSIAALTAVGTMERIFLLVLRSKYLGASKAMCQLLLTATLI